MKRSILIGTFLALSGIISATNLFENSSFTAWSSKSAQSTLTAPISLSYPQGWSIESNDNVEGVTRWGAPIFVQAPYMMDNAGVIEIKGHATEYEQMLYQEFPIESGLYSFTANFKGDDLNAGTYIAMVIKSKDGEVILDEPITRMSGFGPDAFNRYTQSVFIPSGGVYRVGFLARNTDSECRVQITMPSFSKIGLQVSDVSVQTDDAGNGISEVVNRGGKNYIEYQGLPQLLYGIEARIDDYLGAYNPYGNASKLKTIYQYFQKANEAGFKELAIPVPWYWIERNDGIFDFSLVDTLITNAERYDLKLQLIWFGTNVCGWSCEPDYIGDDATQYPRLAIPGTPLDLSNTQLVNRELRAFSRLMDFLYQRDCNRLVYIIQLENEPDHKGGTNDLWAGGQKSAALQTINMLGQIVHSSPISMVTRVNFTGWTTDADYMKDYPGVDIIGRDVYTDNLDNFLSASGYFDYAWNMNHTPENGAQYKNIVNLALATFEQGNGYLHYELRTTDWRTQEYDLGLYRSTTGNEWVERDGTQQVPYSLSKTNPDIEVNMQEVKDFHEMIYKADRQLAASPAVNHAAFNTGNKTGFVYEAKTFGQYAVTYTSEVGGEAFAMQIGENDIILMSLKDKGTFWFASLPPSSTVSVGYFDEENTWIEHSNRVIENNTVVLQAKEVARVQPGNSASLPLIRNDNPEGEGQELHIYGSRGTLVVDSTGDSVYLQVYTVEGTTVFSREIGAGRNEIDLSDFKGKLLLIKVIDSQGYCSCSKILL